MSSTVRTASLGYYQRERLRSMRVINDWHRPLRAPQRRVLDSLVRRGLLVSQDGEYRAVPYEDLTEVQRDLFPYTSAELAAAYPDLPRRPPPCKLTTSPPPSLAS